MRSPTTCLASAALIASLAALLHGCSSAPSTVAPVRVADPLPLAISKLDTKAFAALNDCADDEQLDIFSHYLTEDVELYHGRDGALAGRKALLADLKKNACGKRSRHLVQGSLRVFPIAGYGAIATGRARSCDAKGKDCEPPAEFVIVWNEDDERWRIARMMSFGQAAKD